jgi:hypothetical protein
MVLEGWPEDEEELDEESIEEDEGLEEESLKDEPEETEVSEEESPSRESEALYNQKPDTSGYFPVKEHLEKRYFPPGVLGFARPSTGEAFVNPEVYGRMRGVVKVHEQLHLQHPYLNETAIRMMTNKLSNGPYIPTGVAY